MKLWQLIEHYLGGGGSGNWGHAGRPGQRGGSVARTAGMSRTSGQDWEKRWHEARGDEFGYATAPDSTKMGATKAARFITRKEDTEAGYVKSAAKNTIVTELSSRTGLPYEDVNTVIKQWSHSSNDSDYRSLSMQEAISKEFGVPLSKFQKDELAEYGRAWNDPVGRRLVQDYVAAKERFAAAPYASSFKAGYTDTEKGRASAARDAAKAAFTKAGYGDKYGNTSPERHQPILSHRSDPQGDTRKVVRAMYEHTQSELAKAGITELKLARGSTSRPTVAATGKRAGYYRPSAQPVILATNSASSWTTRKSTAHKFGSPVVSVFPASRVLGCARTGFGCLNEQEYVMLGSTNDRGTLE